MRSPENSDLEPGFRLHRRAFLAGGGALLLGGCQTGSELLNRAGNTAEVLLESQEIIRQRKERETIASRGPEIYRAMASHAVGLAIASKKNPGTLETIGCGQIVRRVSPPGDSRVYRALVTVKHNLIDSVTGDARSLFVLPRDAEPERLERYSSADSIGFREFVAPKKAPRIDTRRIVFDPTSDLAAIPLAAIPGFDQLAEINAIELDERPLLRGDPLLAMNLVPGDRKGWRGLRPTPATVLPQELLIGGMPHPDEWPLDTPMYSGDSGLGVSRLDDPLNPAKVKLAGIVRMGNERTGFGSVIISADRIQRFMTNFAPQLNELTR